MKRMASSILETKLYDPTVAACRVEPYYKCSLDDGLESGAATFPSRTIQSFHAVTRQLRDEVENNELQSLTVTGFKCPNHCTVLGGDGLVSICMNLEESDKGYELVIYDHAKETMNRLGYFPVRWMFRNSGCCRYEPHILCQLTSDGNYVVLYGPREFAQFSSPTKNIPVLAVYQITTATCLFEKRIERCPFITCYPISISINPASIRLGEYQIALATENMEIRFWSAVSEKLASVQLHGVRECLLTNYGNTNPCGNCLRFSPSGRVLAVFCFPHQRSRPICVVLNASSLESVCWVDADMIDFSLLRWYMPIFSACGTRLVLDAFHNTDNKYDLVKYELLFHKIPNSAQSLKFFCRVVILQRVHPSLINQLPLPNDLISYLADGVVPVLSVQSVPCMRKAKTSKCSLM